MNCFSLSQNPPAATASSTTGTPAYAPVLHFDESRNAAADIDNALAEARRSGRRVLIDVGGDWCPYCRQMDQFYQQNPEVRRLRDESFVTVAVFYSAQNKNKDALSHYPKVEGIPHYYVLDSDGTLLHSQHVLELRSKGAYDAEKVREFLAKWSPPKKAPSSNVEARK